MSRPSRLEKDKASLRVLKASRMSPASIASVLGRSRSWVETQLEEIAAEQLAGVESVEAIEAEASAEAAQQEERERAAEAVESLGEAAEIHPTPAAARQAHAAPRGGRHQLKPVTPDVLRWARWFRAARWPVAEVAYLFNRDEDALAAALVDA
jgi:hypothetical protein